MRRILDSLLALSSEIHSHEVKQTLQLAARIFLVLFAYYLMKPSREAFILVDGSAELRSYSVALQALLLLILIPFYSAIFKRTSGETLYARITLFFALNIMLFWAAARHGLPIGIPFFVWLGIFSVTQIAQFWALVADAHKVSTGQRLFALIGVGGSLGAVLGSSLASMTFDVLGAENMLLLASAILLASISIGRIRHQKDSTSTPVQSPNWHVLLGGVHMVMKIPYLRLLAVFVILLNCINSTGEYILARLVVEHFSDITDSAMRGAAIGAFYSDFFFWVNTVSLFLQFFIVSRLYRSIGVAGAIVLLPLLATAGYALLAVAPVFALVRLIKILENSTDYSIQSTSRHALFLPVSKSEKYLGKTTIDTLFWRLGDLFHAAVIFAGTTWIQLQLMEFAMINLVLSLAWVWVAVRVGRYYRAYVATHKDEQPEAERDKPAIPAFENA